MNWIKNYFGVFTYFNFVYEIISIGKEIVWFISTRKAAEKIIVSLGILLVIIKIISNNPSPESALPLLGELVIQLILFSFIFRISDLYWFIFVYQQKMQHVLSNKILLTTLVTTMKKNELFTHQSTQLIADGKTNSNELKILKAYYIPLRSQMFLKRRYLLYCILLSIIMFNINSEMIYLIFLGVGFTFIHEVFYETEVHRLIHQSLNEVAHALYTYHNYDKKACEQFIVHSEDKDLKLLSELYKVVISTVKSS